jgi:hypothetical protein
MSFKISTGASRSGIGTVVIIGAMIFIIVASIFGSVLYLASDQKPSDPNTLCPAKGPLGHIVLLVDKSDPMKFTQRKGFEVMYSEILRKSVGEGYLLSIYALTDDFKQTAEPIIELCNPGDGTNVSEISGAPILLRRDFEKKYIGPLMARFQDLVSEVPGKASPILEMIQLVSITSFRKRSVQGERRLIIVSDMIHHTPQLSMYQTIPEYEQFTQSDYGRRSISDLGGAKVEIRMLLNSPSVQTPALFDFWRNHIRNSAGSVVVYEPLR